MREKFKVEFLKEVFEFLDKLDEKLERKYFLILTEQKLKPIIRSLKN
jgi:mRNA-degrading endonuclease RelE of RelBE toxin-antitoxin system